MTWFYNYWLKLLRNYVNFFKKNLDTNRAAIEYEKKTRAHNLEQRQLMERHKTSMAGEIERLRAELANAEKRARAAAAAANVANPSNSPLIQLFLLETWLIEKYSICRTWEIYWIIWIQLFDLWSGLYSGTGYAVGYGNPVVAYSYPDPYGTDQVHTLTCSCSSMPSKNYKTPCA